MSSPPRSPRKQLSPTHRGTSPDPLYAEIVTSLPPYKPLDPLTPSDDIRIHAIPNPLDASSASALRAAFLHAPLRPLQKPRLWPGPECDATTVKLGWDADHLYALFECFGSFTPPRHSNALARWEEKEGVQPAQRTILCDDRVARSCKELIPVTFHGRVAAERAKLRSGRQVARRGRSR